MRTAGKTSVKPECSGQSDLFDRYRERDLPKELYTISDRVKIHRILPEEFDHGGTRNLGAEMSDAEILVYMTQDAMPADQFLIERLLYGFSYET